MYRAVGKAFVGFAQYFMDCFVLCQDAFYICFIKVPKNNNSIVLLLYFYTCGMFIHVPQQTFIKVLKADKEVWVSSEIGDGCLRVNL